MNTVLQVIALASIFVLPMLALAFVKRLRARREEDERLRELIDNLPPLGARVFELHRKGYNYLEIAGITGLGRQDVLDELTKIYADLSAHLPEERTRKRSTLRLFVARQLLGRL